MYEFTVNFQDVLAIITVAALVGYFAGSLSERTWWTECATRPIKVREAFGELYYVTKANSYVRLNCPALFRPERKVVI